jgi:hypothetical protein
MDECSQLKAMANNVLGTWTMLNSPKRTKIVMKRINN